MKSLLAAIVAAALTTAPAIAQNLSPHAETVTVRTAGLDLASADGRQRLDRRIRAAVAEACGIPSSADLQGHAKVEDCRADLRSRIAPLREAALRSATTSLALSR